MRVRYAYLGPEGTFTEMALRSLPDADAVEPWPQATVSAALDAVRRRDAEGAVVPLENSVEGVVTVTLDELAGGEPLVIAREALLPVEFALLARPGTRREDVKRIVTHPHAHAQCRGWIARHLPATQVLTSSSTAAAAMAVAEEQTAYDAAIAAPIAADHYGLATLARGIGDRTDAVTRFVAVVRPQAPPLPTGADRTSLVAYIADDRPGSLVELLNQFAARGVNLTLIQSRPTGEAFGRYCFSIDCEGHVADGRVGEALMGLRRVCAGVRFLGSYPRADGGQSTIRPGTFDADFADAAAWLARIRSEQT